MRHLLVVSIGPVQEFIVAARRTRDLWFGSEMLSEVSRAAASAIGEGRLIFPASTGRETAPSVANVILAELSDADEPSHCADLARRAAVEKWQWYANQAWELAGSVLNRERWKAQVEDVLEFFAAWMPLPNPDDYFVARRDLMRLIGGRKACRNFKPGMGEAGIPKSSLDGARESVWMDGWDSSKIEPRLARRLRVSTGEQLDAVGVVKRLGGGTRKYPSVSRIAADPWLRGLAQSDREGLDALLRECRDLHGEELLTAVNWTQFSVFPFEGSAVYRNRHHELEEETEAKGRFTELGTIVERLERHGIPNPYLAVLAADGDAMGKAIAEIRSAPRHREFSEDLSRFAKTAKHVVAAHHGYPIYTGGDDVLALVPMDQALECAWQLRNEFGKLMEKWKGSPTLSVGVAIGHFLEPLEDLLNWARAAEKDAKDSGRNALAVHLYPRAGVRLGACGNWNSPLETRLDRQLTSLAKMHMAEAIPDKAGYDLRELARQYEGWPDASDEEKKRLETAIRADAARLIARKRARQPASAESPLLRIVAEATSSASLRAAADRVILAGHFADAMSQARGKQALEEARP